MRAMRAQFGSAAFCLASHRSALLRGVPSRLPPLQNPCFVQSGSVPRLGGATPVRVPAARLAPPNRPTLGGRFALERDANPKSAHGY